ncbi:MAG: hypothetical protein WD960_06750 [Gemmatimonadota bacterium]
MLGTLFLLMALLVVIGALFERARVRRTVDGDEPLAGDDPVLRGILRESEAWEEDEPLDEDEIREEEDRFWEEDWGGSEEWRG